MVDRMLSIATGYNPKYLTGEVAKGTENYYTREVGRGEPPGVWQGGGIAELGLSGRVDDNDMEALFVHFVDPRDPRFRGSKRDWLRARKLGRAPRRYRTAEEILRAALVRESDAEPERVEALRRIAERSARKPVAFIDLTFGVPKSFSILHASLRAQEVHARTAGNTQAAQRWAHQAELLEAAIWRQQCGTALSAGACRVFAGRVSRHPHTRPAALWAGGWMHTAGSLPRFCSTPTAMRTCICTSTMRCSIGYGARRGLGALWIPVRFTRCVVPLAPLPSG